ncbi:glycosylphosphatidylinositol anchor attachment 1 (GPAA1)-like protein, partial [Aphelenchoides avenae]
QVYWARDILFVFVDGGEVGLEAWLGAYHGHEHPHIHAEPLEAHGGAIIGGVALDIVGTRFTSVDIQYGMVRCITMNWGNNLACLQVNGKLPNLDLINLMVILVERAGIPPRLYGITSRPDFAKNLLTVSRSVLSQAAIEIEGLHSVCGAYGINALTIHSRHSQHGSYATHRHDMARVVEGTLRSLNNILEKFHQSYFLYLLAHPHKFVSVAFYMPTTGLLIAAMTILALREWFLNERFEAPLKVVWTHLLAIVCYVTFSQCYSATHPFLRLDVPTISTLFVALAALHVGWLSKISLSFGSPVEYHVTKFVVLLEVALFIGALSLLHYPLALLVGIVLTAYVQLTFLCQRLPGVVKFLLFGILLNPVVIGSCLLAAADHFGLNSANGFRRVDVLSPGYAQGIPQRLIAATTQIASRHVFHGSMLFPIISLVIFPIQWNLSQLLYARV